MKLLEWPSQNPYLRSETSSFSSPVSGQFGCLSQTKQQAGGVSVLTA